MTTVKEAAEAKGLRSYDTALPQDWFDDFYDKTGESPLSQIVWCYDDRDGRRTSSGYPVALDAHAAKLLRAYRASGSRISRW